MLFLVVLLFASAHAVPSSRIINGEDAPDKILYQASLQTTSGFHFCGGAVIDQEWVLTAAHCVDGSTPSSLKVVLNERHLKQDDGQEDYEVTKITMHKDYNKAGITAAFPNDIALLKLASKAPSDHVIPVASSGDFANEKCEISGWGYTSYGHQWLTPEKPDILQRADVQVLSQSQCAAKWSTSVDEKYHVCVDEHNNNNVAACNGDSGGPLRCGEYLVGVTSWGRAYCHEPFGDPTHPSVYVRLTEYSDWISENMA